MYGVVVAVSIMLVAAYVPALQENVFYTSDPPGVAAWIPHLFFLAFISTYTESIKYIARTYPNSFVARYIAW